MSAQFGIIFYLRIWTKLELLREIASELCLCRIIAAPGNMCEIGSCIIN